MMSLPAGHSNPKISFVIEATAALDASAHPSHLLM